MRAPVFAGISDRARRHRLLLPTGNLKLPFRALDIEVGDTHDVHAGRQPRLR
jgi:hypothetical protein